MMSLTQLSVSSLLGRPRRRVDPDAMHRAVMGLFASHPEVEGQRRERLGVLWREEPNGTVLVRSAVVPTNLPSDAQTRAESVAALQPGARVLFRVTANAIRRHAAAAGGGHEPVADVEEWLRGKLAGAMSEVVVFSHDRSVERSAPRGLTVQYDRIDGAGIVGDVPSLERILHHGVGRSKAFGCGLLTVVPA